MLRKAATWLLACVGALIAIGAFFVLIPTGIESARTASIDGPITPRFLERAERAIGNGVEIIRVSSDSGEEGIALRVAELFEARGVRLLIDDRCIGPCATYLIPAAHRVELGPNALVACGANTIALSHLPEDLFSEQHSEEWHDRVDRGRALYARRDIPSGYAINCLMKTVPVCYEQQRGAPVPRTVSSYWVVRTSEFQRLGIDHVYGSESTGRRLEDDQWLREMARSDWDASEAWPSEFLEREIRALARAC